MRTYPKIDTLFNRDPATFRVNVGDFRRPEFAVIDKWYVTEKIDGTNIRLNFVRVPEPEGAEWALSHAIGGRTDNAQIPTRLLAVLEQTIDDVAPEVHKVMEEYNIDSYTLFGEGYGASIQKGGGNYREDQGFILFDILVNDRTWLSPQDVRDTADRLDVAVVPCGRDLWTLQEIITKVSTGFPSVVAKNGTGLDHLAEGIIAVPPVPLYDGRGNRIQFKLKTKDF